MTVGTEHYAEGFHGGIYCLATVDTVHDLLSKVLAALDGEGELVAVPVVGGLHHRYYRAAA